VGYAPVPKKRCTWCGDEKLAANFYLRPSVKSGLSSNCRTCQVASAGRSNKRNPVRTQERREKWKKDHPEKVRARQKIDNRIAYRRHGEKIRAQVRAYSAANRDKINARMASPDGRLRRRLNEGRRRARMEGVISPEQWTAALAAWGHCCAYCGREDVPLQLDHFVPVARGGVHEIHNAVPACFDCNVSKNARDPFEFLAARWGGLELRRAA
jgi:5-methylcytosine-specific restriction endonuclease McrA